MSGPGVAPFRNLADQVTHAASAKDLGFSSPDGKYWIQPGFEQFNPVERVSSGFQSTALLSKTGVIARFKFGQSPLAGLRFTSESVLTWCNSRRVLFGNKTYSDFEPGCYRYQIQTSQVSKAKNQLEPMQKNWQLCR
jgi:hypothetical protein